MATNGFDKRPQDINKEGAPKKDWTWAGLIEKIVDETDLKDKKQIKEKMVRAVIGKALRGDVQAFRELSNRMDGLPKQPIDVTSGGEKITGFNYDFNNPDNKTDPEATPSLESSQQ